MIGAPIAARMARVLALALGITMALTALLPAAMPPVAQAATDTARVRVVHAIPDLGAVDVYVDEELQLSGVPFFTVSDYLELPPGHLRIAVTAAGVPLNGHNALLSGEAAAEAGKEYSVIARGSTASHSTGLTVLTDDNQPPAVGQARLRVAHLSPNAPAVDILVDGARVLTNLSFQQASGYLSVPADSYTVGVAPTGGSPIATFPVTLEAGKVYTAWANGLLGASGAQAFTVTPTVDASYSDTFRLRAIHAVPDIAGSPVDVYLNGVKAVTFDFFDATDYLTLYAGTYDIRVVLAGQNPATQAVIQASVPFAAGKDYSVVARGTASPSDSQPLGADVLTDDNQPPAVGQARLRVAHFSPNAPAVDILVDGARVLTNVSFRDVSGYLSVPAGSYTVGVAPTGGSPIATFPVTLEAGKVYTAWANGLLGTSGAQAFTVTPTVDASYGTARVRVIHASPDAPAVDVFVNGARAVAGLSFAQITDYLTLNEGAASVEIRAAAGGATVFSGSLTLQPGVDYTVAARGLLGGSGAQGFGVSVFEDNTTAPADGKAKVRLIHLSPNAPAVDVRAGSAVLFDDISYLGASQYLEADAGTIGVRVTTADGATTVLSANLTLAPGSVTTVFALGLLGDAPAGQELRVIAKGGAGSSISTEHMLYAPIMFR